MKYWNVGFLAILTIGKCTKKCVFFQGNCKCHQEVVGRRQWSVCLHPRYFRQTGFGSEETRIRQVLQAVFQYSKRVLQRWTVSLLAIAKKGGRKANSIKIERYFGGNWGWSWGITQCSKNQFWSKNNGFHFSINFGPKIQTIQFLPILLQLFGSKLGLQNTVSSRKMYQKSGATEVYNLIDFV